MTTSIGPPTSIDACAAFDWGACLIAHQGWLRKVILARTGDSQAVEEVFQQVALAAVEQKAPLMDVTKAAPWLHRLAVVWSARHRRKLGRERSAMRQVAEQRSFDDAGRPGDLLSWMIQSERHEHVRIAVARMAGADAEILVLKYGEKWSYREIAERLGITEKAVDSRLQRARERLRRELVSMGMCEQER